MSELATRLHMWGNFGYGHQASKDMHEAADRIDALEAENKALRKENVELCEALQPFAALGEAWLPIDEKDKSTWVIAPDSTPVNNLTNFGFTFGHFRAAARVLLAKENND